MADRIPATLAAQITVARRHTPGGQLTAEDMTGLLRRTARLCGVSVEEVRRHIPAEKDAT